MQHFDIKPANVLAEDFGDHTNEVLKIADWGMGQASNLPINDQMKMDDNVHAVCGGTPLYMTPELLVNLKGSNRCYFCIADDLSHLYADSVHCCSSIDNWALAASLLESWTGEKTSLQIEHVPNICSVSAQPLLTCHAAIHSIKYVSFRYMVYCLLHQ